MSLLCKILGHKYGDIETETSESSEGVIKTFEVQTCKRCGKEKRTKKKTKVVSDNQEDQQQREQHQNNQETQHVNDVFEKDINLNGRGDNGIVIKGDDQKEYQTFKYKNEERKNNTETEKTYRVSCSDCGRSKNKSQTSVKDGDYCPNCGGKMTVDEIKQEK